MTKEGEEEEHKPRPRVQKILMAPGSKFDTLVRSRKKRAGPLQMQEEPGPWPASGGRLEQAGLRAAAKGRWVQLS